MQPIHQSHKQIAFDDMLAKIKHLISITNQLSSTADETYPALLECLTNAGDADALNRGLRRACTISDELVSVNIVRIMIKNAFILNIDPNQKNVKNISALDMVNQYSENRDAKQQLLAKEFNHYNAIKSQQSTINKSKMPHFIAWSNHIMCHQNSPLDWSPYQRMIGEMKAVIGNDVNAYEKILTPLDEAKHDTKKFNVALRRLCTISNDPKVSALVLIMLEYRGGKLPIDAEHTNVSNKSAKHYAQDNNPQLFQLMKNGLTLEPTSTQDLLTRMQRINQIIEFQQPKKSLEDSLKACLDNLKGGNPEALNEFFNYRP